ncbi:Similar to Saxiphilin (Lithobates catesbeianus) [Cotesia congregata]|uniref:Similar to Saxiphilin (Lithobates catesbeianus) n=1 Tax=Cotesia congregata TaxID=51543 RepID=A0A8J2H9W2_COTCN|nr:Similar to Saxiphilin (Lithobates catesbeianus) [Cotesia congregata]
MKDSSINKLADLKDKKSCYTFYKSDFTGWLAPVQVLKKAGLITSEEGLGEFFGGSCAPGASKTSPLCQQCVGDMESQDDQNKEATKCQPTQAEDFSDSKGALSCLTSGHGDVAFVPYTVLEKIKYLFSK